jgi:predicted acylesterase/phospholipase RssA
MINSYVTKLIENLPDEFTKKKEPLILDLVLDGGVFNGNYLVGALYFLKEMEKKGYIKVDRISGSSVGSFVGLLYFLDELDCISEINSLILQDFKTNFFLIK